MEQFKFIKYHFKSIIYGVILAMGIVGLQIANNNYGQQIIVIGLISVELLLLLEIGLQQYLAHRKLNQLNLPDVRLYKKETELILHYILPIVTLAAIYGFAIFNNINRLIPIYFLVTSIIYSTLFINISAYRQDKYAIEEQTHFIYDVMRITAFFMGTNLILNLISSYGFNFFISWGILFSFSSLLILLILVRKSTFDVYNILLVLLAGIVVSYMIITIVFTLGINAYAAAFFGTLIFYVASGLIHHELNRTLNGNIISEYLLFAIISLLIILLIS